ncbi:hypothetical protein A3E97_03100 [Candidatus Uhrbacteria bacterium RIFCSPHIGHO2_12_FULL_47_12]|uniref:Uncharacterized protein n=1 Tax=Candidatus Uhrbacteria bacterium RIFCSPLOWO2_02_FULL_48_18 TaxID=1802408 RepID=A0A1F7V9C8_9BACT|nr:MAG: hypothetical protein A3E97_03100 [Candidatus Uhrbacteria bacterium RIFCSPHIGHO2_12_FULL_47_12]OGL81888.1 MAG: hypothetical protein A3B20_02255 [Candidatus Uhrbacteria bacterium RIFCSPLOWO2_01_FULL_47_17]OGL87051.1 MAG: hypothetical protein A3I41_03845 [Candidatus Uhrbacteria bacterium RIFCSPLOWO2_02_FULL_48_18]OGL92735.1 MAG: hypothetical protein A3H12_03650 [Candidatus Uhrbacteria bacterium RIFCSPLOWO2_12_FULL_47_9]
MLQLQKILFQETLMSKPRYSKVSSVISIVMPILFALAVLAVLIVGGHSALSEEKINPIAIVLLIIIAYAGFGTAWEFLKLRVPERSDERGERT